MKNETRLDTVLVLAALVYAERRLIEPRLTGARLSALVQAALVYQEWIPKIGAQAERYTELDQEAICLSRIKCILCVTRS